LTSANKQTFLHGALILVAASALVKVLGAIFKIPLTNLIKEDGMGLFNTSYTLYAFFVLAAKGFSIAVSKMVSESVTLGKRREASRIFYVAFIILGIIGTIGAGLLYWGAEGFSSVFGNTRAALCIKAIAPSVLFVALVSALRGYFQGKQNMYPTALSEVTEALGKLVIGIILAWWFISASIEKAASGAVFGVTCSTFLSLLLAGTFFIFDRRGAGRTRHEKARGIFSIAKELLVISLPITIGASVASLTNVVDMMTIMNRLQSITQVTPEFAEKYISLTGGVLISGGIYESLANKLYGLYSGYAVQLFNLPLTMIVALSTSVLPAISGALARSDINGAQRIIKSVIRITVLFSLPCAAGLSVVAGPVLQLIFNDSLARDLLSTISLAIVFVSVVQVTNAILQAYGKMHIPVINMLIGCMVKIIANYYLVAIPSLNIDGAPLGTIACYFIIAALNIICIIKITGISFGLGEFVVKPVASAAGMGIIVVFMLNMLSDIGFGVKSSGLLAVVTGVIVYTVLVFLVGAVTKTDIEMLPMGKKAAIVLDRLHLLKK
jgi:stage V sporulation protein B